MAKERAILKPKEHFDEMIRQAATESRMINEVEGDIWKRLLKIERLTLQGYVDLQGTADLGPTLEYKDQVLKRLAGLYDRGLGLRNCRFRTIEKSRAANIPTMSATKSVKIAVRFIKNCVSSSKAPITETTRKRSKAESTVGEVLSEMRKSNVSRGA